MPRDRGSDVGLRLAQARRQAGLTQAQLAEKVGIDRTALSKIESGRRRVDTDELISLAEALGQQSSSLLGSDEGLDLRTLRRARRQILDVAATHGATNVRVFGSLARNEGDERSDIDLLVDMEPDHSLLDRTALAVDLQELLGCRVDVATPQALRDRIRDRVLREAVPL